MRNLLLAALLLTAAALPAQQPSMKSSGRYQIIVATVGNGDVANEKTVHTVFLLDTETGQVWRYFAGAGATKELSPEEQHAIGLTTLAGVNAGLFAPVERIAPQPQAAHRQR